MSSLFDSDPHPLEGKENSTSLPPARQTTFDFGDKYHQMESSDVVKKFTGLSIGHHIDHQR
jgi:hypothetical protein